MYLGISRRARPLPSGRMSPAQVLAFGLALGVAAVYGPGVELLAAGADPNARNRLDATISDTAYPAPSRLQSARNGRSVTE